MYVCKISAKSELPIKLLQVKTNEYAQMQRSIKWEMHLFSTLLNIHKFMQDRFFIFKLVVAKQAKL